MRLHSQDFAHFRGKRPPSKLTLVALHLEFLHLLDAGLGRLELLNHAFTAVHLKGDPTATMCYCHFTSALLRDLLGGFYLVSQALGQVMHHHVFVELLSCAVHLPDERLGRRRAVSEQIRYNFHVVLPARLPGNLRARQGTGRLKKYLALVSAALEHGVCALN